MKMAKPNARDIEAGLELLQVLDAIDARWGGPRPTEGPLAKRRVFDYIRGSYDLGYNDARNARAVPGDNAPGYKGRDVEVDHGGALFNALRACITAPQPARQPLIALPDGDIVFFSDRGDAVTGYSAQRVWEILRAHGIGE